MAFPGVTRHIKKFLCGSLKERGGGITLHTSGFNCDWLKVVIVKEVFNFRHFAASASVVAVPACLALCLWGHRVKVSTNVASHTRHWPLYQAGLRKTHFFVFFEKKLDFVLILRKTEKLHSELFLLHHAILLFSELHNNNLLYLLWHSKLRVKKCAPSLFSQSVVGQFTPKW